MGLLGALVASGGGAVAAAFAQACGRQPGALINLLKASSASASASAWSRASARRACSGGPAPGPGGYHKIRLQPGTAERKRFVTVKEATAKLVENLRRTPVDTAKQFAGCLTPAERGAMIYALRRQNTKEVSPATTKRAAPSPPPPPHLLLNPFLPARLDCARAPALTPTHPPTLGLPSAAQNVLETEEAFLEADSNMDGKLSR